MNVVEKSSIVIAPINTTREEIPTLSKSTMKSTTYAYRKTFTNLGHRQVHTIYYKLSLTYGDIPVKFSRDMIYRITVTKKQ